MWQVLFSLLSAIIGGLAVAYFNNREVRLREELKTMRDKAEIAIGDINVLAQKINRCISYMEHCVRKRDIIDRDFLDADELQQKSIRQLLAVVGVYFQDGQDDALKFVESIERDLRLFDVIAQKYNLAIEEKMEISIDDFITMINKQYKSFECLDKADRIAALIMRSVFIARERYEMHSPLAYVRVRPKSR